MNPYAAQINIDGSCYKNPGGNGGFAGILEMPDEEDYEILFQEGYQPTTNNRMEMRALIAALKYIKQNKSSFRDRGITEVEIYTDSENTITCYKKAEIWNKDGWLGVYKNPIRNIDLLKEIITLKNSVGFRYALHHIANKSTPISIIVDKLAKAAAKKSVLKNDNGYIKPKVSKTNVTGKTELFDAKGEERIIRVFEHAPVSRRKDSLYKVKFEVLNVEGTEKYCAHTSTEINAKLHRWHYYSAKFNNGGVKNPIITSVEELENLDLSAQWD